MSLISNVTSVILTLLVFSILIVFHELGHFIFAKKNGICVEEFAVGMGNILFSKKIGETLYSVRMFPVGGFCRMKGGEDEDEYDRSEDSYMSKSVFAKISVVAAGPAFSFLLSFLFILALISINGYLKAEVVSVIEGYSASEAGILPGDEIISIDGQKLLVYEDFQLIMDGSKGNDIELGIIRDGEYITKKVTPMRSPDTGRYLVGFTPAYYTGIFSKDVEGYQKADIISTITTSFKTMVFYIKSTAVGFVRLFTFKLSPDEFSGPIGIATEIGKSYESGLKYSFGTAIQNLMSICALLSANLGVINLFPIPAVDGGRLVFLAVEAIRGKPMNPQREGVIHFIGFVLLFAFMIFIAFSDVMKLFS